MNRFLKLCLLLLLAFPAAAQDGADEAIIIDFSPVNVNFDPHHSYTATEAQIFTGIYEGLVTYNPLTLEPQPGVAQLWQVSEDKTRYTFYMRDDARFWNGDPITAEVFRQSYLRLLDPREKAEYSFLFDIIEGARDYRTGRSSDPDSVGIRVNKDGSLTIQLAYPAVHFIKILCHHSFVPIHPDFLDVSDWNEPPTVVGNGPFYIHSHDTDKMVLKKNALYWDREDVAAEEITILFSDSAETTARRVNAGEILWSAGTTSWDLVTNPDALNISPQYSTNYFYFASGTAPWDDRRIRRGLALLLPWQTIRSREVYFIPTSRLVPGDDQYPAPLTIDRSDVSEGLRLLEEAGYSQGRDLPEIVIAINPGQDQMRVAQIMKNSWEKQVDVQVRIIVYPWSEYYNALKNEPFTLGLLTWIGDFADPLTFLQMWTSESNLNDAGYSDVEFDSLIDRSMQESDEERYSTLSRAEGMLLETAAVLPLKHDPSFNIVNAHILDGWYPNALDIHPFKYFAYRAPRVLPRLASLSRSVD